MSADRQDPHEEIEGALRTLDHPAARPEFRDELRRRFLDEASAGVPARRRPGARIVGLLAAAAVLVAAGYFLLRPRPAAWRVLQIAPGSVVQADGAILPTDDLEVLAGYLRGAREIVVERGDLVLQVGDVSLFDLAEGTRVAFAGFGPGTREGPLSVVASSGRLRVRTGPGFAGRTMDVRAGPTELTVTGTAFAVDYEDVGTCVCCLHGSVAIAAQAVGPDAMAIQPGKMCLVFLDDRNPLWGESPVEHALPLRHLEERARELWR